jgi:hydroxyacylglutathione hydrolase
MPDITEIAPGIFVTTSEFALTTTTVVAGADGGCLLVDPGVTVAELQALADSLAGQGLRPVVAWSTHPHWDHVLWHCALGTDVPRYAAPAAVAITESERDGMVEGVQGSAPGHDLALFGHVTTLPAAVIPWNGPAAQLVVHNAHAPGHGAVFLPDSGVFIVGDMCSDVEIPLLDTVADDPMGDYRTGIARLGEVSGVRQVVPGHGHIGDAGEFRRRLEADTGYLDKLEQGASFDDSRITKDWMRGSHEAHLAYFRK